MATGLFEGATSVRERTRPPATLPGRVPPGPTGLVFDVQRFSIHDGPGIRTTVFLKGCPLRCDWCHNPESQDRRPELAITESRCIHCGSCGSVCPLGLAGGPYVTDPMRCDRCGRCVAACPTGARRLVGELMTPRRLLEAVERDRPFFDESGGGVTFSGGEPLAQPRFLLACLREARVRGIHTTVDTCGVASPITIRRVAALADLFLYDLKVLDPERHRRFTGVPLEPILDNLRQLDERGARIWLRVPLIPGRNDDVANLEDLARLALGLRTRPRLHLLPYHRLGADKRGRGGRVDRAADVEPPDEAAVARAAGLLQARGLDVRIGG